MYEEMTTDSIVQNASLTLAELRAELNDDDIMQIAGLELVGFMIEELARRIPEQRGRLVEQRKNARPG